MTTNKRRIASSLIGALCLATSSSVLAQQAKLDLAEAVVPQPIPIPIPVPQPPPQPNVFDGGNRWLITAYNDASPVHQQLATQGICFLPYVRSGTHIRGAWYSDTFPNWTGRYSQEGDKLLMHGDYALDVGHDAMEADLFAGTSRRDEAAGQWTEWRETVGFFGRTVVFANTSLQRVGRCHGPLDETTKSLPSVTPRFKTNGDYAENPLDADQEPLLEELDI